MGTKALLVGINTYPDAPLRGCINDIENMRALLQHRHTLTDEQMHIVRDREATKDRIVQEIQWLAAPDAGETNPVRLFHYSGHGTYVVDQNGDEPDGRDEAIVPYDFRQNGVLTDDVLHQLYNRFGRATHLLLTMDCCHSGTITRNIARDVVYRYLPNTLEEEQAFREAAMRALRGQPIAGDEFDRRVEALMNAYDKKHFGVDKLRGNVVLIAACRADQTAADAQIGGSFNGAFTYFLADVLHKAGGEISYDDLIGEVGKQLYAKEFAQIPQLECSSSNRSCAFLHPAI